MSEAAVVSCSAEFAGDGLGSGPALSGVGAPEAFSAVVERLGNGDLAVIARGELDLATHDQLRRALEDARVRGTLAEIDLSALTFMDVTAVQVILDAGGEIGSASPAIVVRVGRIAARLLSLAQVDHLLVLRPPRGKDTTGEA